jgi:hypothetical protein
MHPNASACTLQRRVRNHVQRSDAYAWFNVLTGPELFEQVESLLPQHRERLFPPTETLSMFLAQALSADRSCQSAVNEAAVRRTRGALPRCSTHTGAYCRARQRLPMEMTRALARFSGQRVAQGTAVPWRWRGRAVRLVDGTTISLPDTPANQTAYPQSCTQKPGLGFPLCRLVGMVCLGSGAILEAATGRYQGKGGDEQSLLRSILHSLQRGDVLLGDAYYATYFLLCTLLERGVDAVFEQHGSRRRSTDFRCGQRLGERDHLIVLHKPDKPDWMSSAEHERTPDTITVREVRTGGKTLVTTLLCPKQTSKSALKCLYRNRWHVELDLRNIKTTLGMERLSCQSPAMAIKEIWVYLLAYNLIRLIMTQAARLADRLPRQLSFKHTVQLCLAWDHHQTPGACQPSQLQDLLVLIAQQRVGERPGRIEPRAIKRRPKPYPLLTTPRAIARAKVTRYGHPTKLK